MVESPLHHKRHKREDLVRYAQCACLDAIERGFAPFASHLFYTHLLTEDPISRACGLACRDAIALPLLRAGGVVLRYVDFGITPGMIRDCDQGFPVDSLVLLDRLMQLFRSGHEIPASLSLSVR